MGCWVSPDIGRVFGFGCDAVGLNICEFEVYASLRYGMVCARVGLRGWADLMRVCLGLRLLIHGLECRLSRNLAAMSCARKM